MTALVELEEGWRSFQAGGDVVHALRDVSLQAHQGELLALQGRSGSGKTTLLNIVGGLDRLDSGRIHVDGTELTDLPEPQRVELRRERIGFVFQAFGLVPVLTAEENVEIPLRLVRTDPGDRAARVGLLLELVGLEDRRRHRPHELSGGEQQRVAIARALANAPKLLLADEPTSQLDSATARTIMQLLRTVVHEEGVTALVATHDPALVDVADRTLILHDGALADGAASF